MLPYHSLEFFGEELRRERLREAEQFRLVRLVTEQQPRITRRPNWKSGPVTLLLKLGVITALLPLVSYLVSS